jgi:hypothetical protein
MRWQRSFAIPVVVSALSCTSGFNFARYLPMDVQAMDADCGDWASRC